MNILCPNCQKPISVDERYSGQLMKCPLCAGTFTVPLLPDAALPSRPAAPATTPEAHNAAPTAHEDAYNLAAEPAPAPPLAPVPPQAAPSISTQPTRQPRTEAYEAPKPSAEPAPPPPPAGYIHTRTWRLNPEIMPWIAPAALVLALIISFFPWVGAYPNGLALLWQNGWQAAFSSYSGDWTPPASPGAAETTFSPGANPLLILDLLLLLLPAVVVAVTVALFQFNLIHVPRPPIVQQLWPWRQWIVAGLALASFLFLFLQMLLGFRVESALQADIEKRTEIARSHLGKDDTGHRLDVQEAQEIAALGLHRTRWLRLFELLELVAVVGAVLDAWLERRGTRARPQVQFMW